jgi:hypothetical protein
MQNRLIVGCFVAALLFFIQGTLAAQIDTRDRRLPLGPNRPAGEAVAPFLETWYPNPDGTYTISFGYFNFNTTQSLDIPIGPNNRLEPAEFNGMQPTHFPGAVRGIERHERGVFTVTVPADYANGAKGVTWTLTANGETHSVLARVGAQATQADYNPMALGSVPPYLSFAEGGPRVQGVTGIMLDETLTTRVGQPVTVSVWSSDPSLRSREILAVLYEDFPVIITWYKHQGPVGGVVTFQRTSEPWQMPGQENATPAEQERNRLEGWQDRLHPAGGQSTVTATFDTPGDYVLRVRADNFAALDSGAGDQCCWTNGYVRVHVTP